MLQAEVKQYGRSSGSKHGDDYLRDLQLLRLLGRGGFANVYEARWQGCQTAVKVSYLFFSMTIVWLVVGCCAVMCEARRHSAVKVVHALAVSRIALMVQSSTPQTALDIATGS
jgi:serine/threonine protein kinase